MQLGANEPKEDVCTFPAHGWRWEFIGTLPLCGRSSRLVIHSADNAIEVSLYNKRLVTGKMQPFEGHRQNERGDHRYITSRVCKTEEEKSKI